MRTATTCDYPCRIFDYKGAKIDAKGGKRSLQCATTESLKSAKAAVWAGLSAFLHKATCFAFGAPQRKATPPVLQITSAQHSKTTGSKHFSQLYRATFSH